MTLLELGSLSTLPANLSENLPLPETELAQLIQSIAKKGLNLAMYEYQVKGTNQPKTYLEKLYSVRLDSVWRDFKAAEETYRDAIWSLRPGSEALPLRYEELIDRVRVEEEDIKAKVLSVFQSHIRKFQQKEIGMVYNIEKESYQVIDFSGVNGKDVRAFHKKVFEVEKDATLGISKDVIHYIFSESLSNIQF